MFHPFALPFKCKAKEGANMEVSVKISKKGQITLPKRVREALGVKAGEKLVIKEEEGKVLIEKAPSSPFDEFYGYLNIEGVTTDEIMKEIRGER